MENSLLSFNFKLKKTVTTVTADTFAGVHLETPSLPPLAPLPLHILAAPWSCFSVPNTHARPTRRFVSLRWRVEEAPGIAVECPNSVSAAQQYFTCRLANHLLRPVVHAVVGRRTESRALESKCLKRRILETVLCSRFTK